MSFKISELSAFSNARLGTSDNAIDTVGVAGLRSNKSFDFFGSVQFAQKLAVDLSPDVQQVVDCQLAQTISEA